MAVAWVAQVQQSHSSIQIEGGIFLQTELDACDRGLLSGVNVVCLGLALQAGLNYAKSEFGRIENDFCT